MQTTPTCFRLTCALLSLVLLAGCGSGIRSSGALINTASSVELSPVSGEDLAGPCRFDLVLPDPTTTQKGVLVFFERGDTDRLYVDQSVHDAALALGYALVWARQCDALSTGDLQSDASKGPARMLFAALSDLGANSGHVELANASVILFGFSAAGVLTATMVNERPDRIIGSIQYAAGSASVDLDDVAISSRAKTIPTLVLANALDPKSGTSRPYRYFTRGRALGAPWAYAVQETTAHCCTLTTRSVLLPWIQAVAAGSMLVSPSQSAMIPDNSTMATFSCTPNGVRDGQGEINCSFSKESLTPTIPISVQSAWLPNTATGAAWLTWVTNSAN